MENEQIQENQATDNNQYLLEQTIVKFKTFLIEDLSIPEYKLNTNQGLQEQLNVVKQFKVYINMIGKDQVSNYVSSVIINHFGISQITKEQKDKLNNFIELFLEFVI
ncbi:hypothetical protein ABPG72_016890 [Tetrahymena utriculariae]